MLSIPNYLLVVHGSQQCPRLKQYVDIALDQWDSIDQTLGNVIPFTNHATVTVLG